MYKDLRVLYSSASVTTVTAWQTAVSVWGGGCTQRICDGEAARRGLKGGGAVKMGSVAGVRFLSC